MIDRMTPSDAAAVSRFLSEKALSEPSGKPAELLHRVIAHLNGYIKSETAGIINDGGPAFPMQDQQAIHAWAQARIEMLRFESTAERDAAYIQARAEAIGGMSLRDYFAAKALAGFASDGEASWKDGAKGMARCAYEWADAMLKARSEGGAA